MPPKCKFTREEIVQTALNMVREDGIESVTARSLGAKLGASSKPIFSVFENMEELMREVMKAARDTYNAYVKIGLSQVPAFKGVGTQYIRFAQNEPKLFQLLFMSEQTLSIPGQNLSGYGQKEKKDALGVLPLIDDNYEKILASIENGYGIGEPDAKVLYRHLWIYTHGIASLLATNVCAFQEKETDNLITEVFRALLTAGKAGKTQ